MKYIDRSKVAEPANLKGLAAPSNDEDVDDRIYGHENVKTALNNLQQGICCYCESYYAHTTYGDVEHYRPKGFYQQFKGDKQHRPGYYWVAYKWENLMYACEQCNRSYKRNYFPLKDPQKRFDPTVLDISEEEPLLINPYDEVHPEAHLTFKETTIVHLTEKGDMSIKYYGLDREALNEERRKVFNPINALVESLEIVRGTGKEKEVESKVRKIVDETIKSGRYTLMIKCNFREYI